MLDKHLTSEVCPQFTFYLLRQSPVVQASLKLDIQPKRTLNSFFCLPSTGISSAGDEPRALCMLGKKCIN